MEEGTRSINLNIIKFPSNHQFHHLVYNIYIVTEFVIITTIIKTMN